MPQDLWTCDYCGHDEYFLHVEDTDSKSQIHCCNCGSELRYVTTYPYSGGIE